MQSRHALAVALAFLVWVPLGAADNPEVKWILETPEMPVQSVAFSPDGKLIATASGGDKKSVVVWDVTTGKEKFELPGHRRPWLVAFLPGGKELVADSGPDLSIQVWDLETRKVRLKFKMPLRVGNHYAVSPDGKWLAATDAEGGIHQHSLATGEAGKKIKGHPRDQCVTYSPDGKRLVSGHDWSVFVWDATTGECLANNKEVPLRTVAVCLSPDGKVLYTADTKRFVVHWDAPTLKPTHKVDLSRWLNHSIERAVLSPDGRTLAVQTQARVALYDVQTRTLRDDFAGEGQLRTKECMAFSPDGKLLATGSGGRPTYDCAFLWKIPPPPESKK